MDKEGTAQSSPFVEVVGVEVAHTWVAVGSDKEILHGLEGWAFRMTVPFVTRRTQRGEWGQMLPSFIADQLQSERVSHMFVLADHVGSGSDGAVGCGTTL